jgi:hypothetical protein
MNLPFAVALIVALFPALGILCFFMPETRDKQFLMAA